MNWDTLSGLDMSTVDRVKYPNIVSYPNQISEWKYTILIDRDNHIYIEFKGIPKSLQGQYRKAELSNTNYFNVPYDLSSIMHYGSSGVINALDPKRSFLMGQRVKLSFLDIQLANIAYKCNGLKPVYS